MCDDSPLMSPAASCFPLWSLAPFLLMLVSIAVLPMTVPDWWDNNRNKTILSVVMSLPVIAVVVRCEPRLLVHSLLDYVSFFDFVGLAVRDLRRDLRQG